MRLLQVLPSPDALPDASTLSFLATVGTGAIGTGSAFLKAVTPVVPDPELLKNTTAATGDLPPLDTWLSASSSSPGDEEERPHRTTTSSQIDTADISDSNAENGLTPESASFGQEETQAIDLSTFDAPIEISEESPTPTASRMADEIIATSGLEGTEVDRSDISENLVVADEISSSSIAPLSTASSPENSVTDSVADLRSKATIMSTVSEDYDEANLDSQLSDDRLEPSNIDNNNDDDKQANDPILASSDNPTPQARVAVDDKGKDPAPLVAMKETISDDRDVDFLAASDDQLATSPATQKSSLDSPTSQELRELSLASLLAENDVMLSQKARNDSPAVKKHRNKKLQENIHLISSLQDSPGKKTEGSSTSTKKATWVDQDIVDSARKEQLVPDPTHTQTENEQINIISQRQQAAADALDDNIMKPLVVTTSSDDAVDDKVDDDNIMEPSVPIPDEDMKQDAIATEENTLPIETTEEDKEERLFPTTATGDDFTAQIREYIQREAAKTTRELWRRKEEKVKLEKAKPGSSRTGSNVLLSTSAVKQLPRKPKKAEKGEAPSELLVRLPTQPLERSRYPKKRKLFSRPSDAAREAAKTSSVALSLGYAKLIKVSKKASGNPLTTGSSRTTNVMLAVLVVLSCNKALLHLIRRFFI